ncbi:hypothetical protein GCM10023235_41880 [Kitasatospora terrestris]|uniref:Uncharacterized protein n=1 Tax=Kitasatospora terrestris TaxID=258051 RepID=A0ABP9DTI7_9ACTN
MLGQVPNMREKPNCLDLPRQVVYVECVATGDAGAAKRGLLWAAPTCAISAPRMGGYCRAQGQEPSQVMRGRHPGALSVPEGRDRKISRPGLCGERAPREDGTAGLRHHGGRGLAFMNE